MCFIFWDAFFFACPELPEAINITPNQKHELMTTRSWDFLGLKNEPPSEFLQRSNYGEDIIIGIIGTGKSIILI